MASVISNTVFWSFDSIEFCDRLKLLLQEIQAGKIFDINNDEIVAVVNNVLEYKCIYKKQHKQTLNKCKLLHI